MSTKPPEHRGCDKIKELISEYLDRNLHQTVFDELESHFQECRPCRIFINTVEKTITLYKYRPQKDVPEEVRLDLRRLLREKHQAATRQGRDEPE